MRGLARGRAARVFLLAVAALVVSWGVTAASAFVAPVGHQTLRVAGARAATWVDLDGDGDGDLVLADRAGRLGVALDDGGLGTLRVLDQPALAGRVEHMVAADVDRDGDTDLVVCLEGRKRALGEAACRLLLGRPSADAPFADATDVVGLAPSDAHTIPLLADYDGDGDQDLFLFPERRRRPARLFRNDLDGDRLVFTALDDVLPVAARGARQAAIVDADGRGTTLWLVRRGLPAALLVLDPASGRYVDQATPRGLPKRATRGGLVAAGDFDGDRLPDVLAFGTGRRPTFLRQSLTGGFTALAVEARGSGVSALAAADFDRDGRLDVYAARARAGSALLQNIGPAVADGPPRFTDVAADAGVREAARARAAGTFLRVDECDFGVDLLVAPARPSTLRVHRFPADSAGHTTVAGGPETTAGRRGGCVVGTDAAERLVGHRVASVLRGAGGDDELVARGGVTVMDGGPGRDTFHAAGFTVVRLGDGEVAPGETLHCGDAEHVWVDTRRTRRELEATGFVFEHCFEEAECDEPSDPDGLACHGVHSNLSFVSLGQTAFQMLHTALDFGFAAPVGGGFGECSVNPDCYAIGLDVCRTATGDFPSPPGMGRCYPSDFDGLEGPIPAWCHDPFWARLRYEEVRAQLAVDGRKLVLPVVVWIVRSDAATSGGSCTFGGDAVPPSIESWHASFAKAMNSTMALFAKWGLVFDYAFRVVEVPSDSDFVADAASDRCRVKLVHKADVGDEDENRTIGKLLAAFPSYYRPGQVNIYLSDVAATGTSAGSGVSWSDPVRFIILRETAGALAHEMGHQIGLAHPYDDNAVPAGAGVEEVESRDSWNARPFPDPAVDRLRLCASDAQCTGVDAPAGDCRKAPGAATGYCRNLKVDCAEDGDGICDTPWDAFPCFSGVSHHEGDACVSHADCQTVSNARGTGYLTACFGGHCLKVPCVTNGDCAGGSWCAGGACVNYKGGSVPIDACCDLHTDRRPGFVHNACWDHQPDGDVVPSPGVGNATTWPLVQNVMGYHSPTGLPKTLTPGQRDRVICGLSYTHVYDQLQRIPRADGEPCTLRPGGSDTTYGPVGADTKVAHGACASGICRVFTAVGETTGVCTASSCTDLLVGADEASRDCGGVCPTPCETSRDSSHPPTVSACFGHADCVSGVCADDLCQPTCSDGARGGSELAVDKGGAGFAPVCGGQGPFAPCRFDADCSSDSCLDDGNCVASADCPVNQAGVPCTADGDCGTGSCVVLARRCNLQSCVLDAQCPSDFCDLSVFRCACADASECPGPGDACAVSHSLCTEQCVDGRCLGTCEIGLGG